MGGNWSNGPCSTSFNQKNQLLQTKFREKTSFSRPRSVSFSYYDQQQKGFRVLVTSVAPKFSITAILFPKSQNQHHIKSPKKTNGQGLGFWGEVGFCTSEVELALLDRVEEVRALPYQIRRQPHHCCSHCGRWFSEGFCSLNPSEELSDSGSKREDERGTGINELGFGPDLTWSRTRANPSTGKWVKFHF